MQRAQEVIDRVCEQRVLYEAEVVKGEARIAKFVAEAANIQGQKVVLPQVSELQARINVLVSERDALCSAVSVQLPREAQRTWTASGRPRSEDIPAHTHLQRPGSWHGRSPQRDTHFPDDDERSRSAPCEGRFAP